MRDAGCGVWEKVVFIKNSFFRIPHPVPLSITRCGGTYHAPPHARYALRVLFLLSLLVSPVLADAPAVQQPPVLVEKYANDVKDDYLQELTRVRTYLSIAERNIATQLGLMQYGEGFFHPVQIRFDDGSPAVNQNPFFYVLVRQPGSEDFRQELVVNVEAYARNRKDSNWKDNALRNGFYYAMAQLMFNDLTRGQGFPLWVQEGLAVYVSGSGEAMLADAVGKTRRSDVPNLIIELNQPYPYLTKNQWAQYYLAIKYISDTGGVNGFQAFVREIVSGSSAADTVRRTLNQEWPDFKKNVHTYTANAYLHAALADNDPRAQNTPTSAGSY
jgi:hypothetical protein